MEVGQCPATYAHSGTTAPPFSPLPTSALDGAAYTPSAICVKWPNWQAPVSTRKLADHHGARGGGWPSAIRVCCAVVCFYWRAAVRATAD